MFFFSGFVPDIETLHNAAYTVSDKAMPSILRTPGLKPDLQSLHYALTLGYERAALVLIKHGVVPDQVGPLGLAS